MYLQYVVSNSYTSMFLSGSSWDDLGDEYSMISHQGMVSTTFNTEPKTWYEELELV